MAAHRTVLLDCDSTLTSIEGIDELARDVRAEIEPLTEAAMRGDLPLEAVYGRRLSIIRPSRDDVARVGRLYVEHLVPGARETVAAMQRMGIDVRIISGGVRQAVLHLARVLQLPDDRVFAVDLHFDDAGGYAGFDELSPLARAGGKPALISSWSDLARPVMLVGDGATDLEAKGVVDTFVAFTGVTERANVVAGADVVVRTLTLLPVLTLALDGEIPESPGIRQLVAQGAALLA